MDSVLILILCALMYFLPTIVAVGRKHHNAVAVALLNIFLGWTFVGWIISLVWAVSKPAPAATVVINNSQNS